MKLWIKPKKCSLGKNAFYDLWSSKTPPVSVKVKYIYILMNDSSIISSVGLLGLLFGAIFFGWLSDKVGRRKSLLLAAVGASICSYSVSFAANVQTFTILRFFAGLFVHGSIPGKIILFLNIFNKIISFSFFRHGIDNKGQTTIWVNLFTNFCWYFPRSFT